MAFLVARMSSTSVSWSSAVAGIWRRRALSPGLWLHLRYSDSALDGRVSPSLETSSVADLLLGTPSSGDFSPAISETQTIGADKRGYERREFPVQKSEGFRVYRAPRRISSVGLEPRLFRRALNEEVSPVGECIPAFRNEAHKSFQDSPREGSFCKTQQPIASPSGRGSIDLASASNTSEAIAFLKHRQQESLHLDPGMIIEILKQASKQKDLTAARQLHECIIQSGLDKNPYVMNTLMNAYIRCGRLYDARRVFDGFEKKEAVAWRIMIAGYAENGHAEDAMEVFNRMRQGGIQPNEITLLRVLKACASPVALKWGKALQSYMEHTGLEANVRLGTALVQMYAKCGSITEARQAFEKLPNRDGITWNAMIGAYAESGMGVEAYQLFLQMMREGFTPNAITYISILNASASTGALEWVKEVHDHAQRVGLESDHRVGNALVHMYGKSGSIDDARLVFDRMEKRDVTTWTSMIGAYAEKGCGVETYQLFLQMIREGFIPNAITYMSILNASASTGTLEWVKEVHGHAQRAGLESDLRVGNALVRMYGKCGSIDDAGLVFDRMKKRDVTSWTIMIGAYAESGFGVEAFRLFLQMNQEGFVPNAITYMSILNASASVGALEWVKEVHSYAYRARLESDLRVGNALVHMYSKIGSIDDALLVFDRMNKRDVVTYSTMIGGLGQHGRGHEALTLFQQMNANCVKPNGASFVAVLSACCHAGLLDEGRKLFLGMTEDFGIEPTVLHYTCMVDLLGRAGLLEEATLLIREMPVEADAVIWTALLGACRTYGNIELGELAAKEALQLEAKDSSPYILLSNIYAAAGKWEKVSSVRIAMKERGLKKEAGRSWIEVDNKIHEFVAGDTSHPEAKAIYGELNKLTEQAKAEGYVPETQLVLHDINEEDKDLALCSHSEKLAIVYGLMRTPLEEPVRVYKNLRVCSDCHAATRVISKVTGREIIARDANRFHHFKDGVCSCGQYW